MFNAHRATIATALSAALLSATSAAFGAVNTGWTQLSPSPPGVLKSVAAFPSGVYALTSTGIYYDFVWNNPAVWTFVTTTDAVQIASDSFDNLYILSKTGVPQKWTGTAFTWVDPVNSPGTSGSSCQMAKDIAVGESGRVYVTGCAGVNPGNNQLVTTWPGRNWGAVSIGPTNVSLVAVAANQLNAGAWVVDAKGGTWLVSLNGDSPQQYARPEYIGGSSPPTRNPPSPQPHTIGLFGGSNQVLGIAGGNPNGSGDFPIAFWANPGWSSPYLGGWAHILSANSYTAAVLAVNVIFVYSLN